MAYYRCTLYYYIVIVIVHIIILYFVVIRALCRTAVVGFAHAPRAHTVYTAVTTKTLQDVAYPLIRLGNNNDTIQRAHPSHV